MGAAGSLGRRWGASPLLFAALWVPLLAPPVSSAELHGPPTPARLVAEDISGAQDRLTWKGAALPVAFASAADIATTEWAISSGNAVEGNPFMHAGPGGRAAVKLAGASAVVAGIRHLDRTGHQRAARACLWSYVGVNLGVAWHNARLARRR